MTDDGGRKRKRKSHGDHVSSKKAALGSTDADLVKIHWVEEDASNPVIVSAPGLVTPAIPFTPYAKQLSAGKPFGSSTKPSTHNLLLHSSRHPRLDYTASTISLDQQQSHYVGIFDPTSHRLQLIPSHHLSLRSTLRSQPKDEDQQRRTMAQQREELGREFGTKKAKKVIDARTVNAISRDVPVKDGVQNAILDSMAGSALPTLSEQDQLADLLASKPIPKPNLTPSTVEDVYPFDVLIPPRDARLIAIKDWQDNARNEVAMQFSHRFPAFRVGALGRTDDVLRLKALRYLDLLLRFHDILQNAGKAGKKVPKKEVLQTKLSDWPDQLVDSVRRRFANEVNELPKWHMDNLYTHMCALSLFVDGWTTDTTHLKDDLRMDNKEIVAYFRELGCKLAGPTEEEKKNLNAWFATGIHQPMTKGVAAVTRVAKLRIPPDYPKARMARKR